MDTLDNFMTWLSDPIVKWAFPIALVALYVVFLIVRGIFRALFSSKSKSFSVDISEYHNQPMGSAESIGSISMRLGDDVRDVWGKGYSDEQVNGVLTGKYSLEEMYKMPPAGRK